MDAQELADIVRLTKPGRNALSLSFDDGSKSFATFKKLNSSDGISVASRDRINAQTILQSQKWGKMASRRFLFYGVEKLNDGILSEIAPDIVKAYFIV